MAAATLTATTAGGSLMSGASAPTNGTTVAPYDLQTAFFAFFQDKKNVSLFIVVPLIGFLYAAACISYAISRCRRKKVRAARRRRTLSSGEIDAREFVNAQAARHGSESSLKSLISKDRNRVAPEMTSVERQTVNTYNKADTIARGGRTLDFVASNNAQNARDHLSATSGVKLSVAPSQKEQGQGKRVVAGNRFSDPSILGAIKEEPSSSGEARTVAAMAAGARDSRRTSYPMHAGQDKTLSGGRLNSDTLSLARPALGGAASTQAAAAPPYTGITDRRSKSIPLQEHVEEALQSLRLNSSVDAPSGKDLRNAMKTVISLEMEVKNDPKAQEMIARYRESKQKNRQTNINDNLKKGEWQKVPISDYIALKRAASEADSGTSSLTASTLSRY